MQQRIFRFASWGGLGDALLSTPTYKALKEKYHDCRIDMLCPPGHAEVYRHNPYIDKIIQTSFRANPISYLWAKNNRKKFKKCAYGLFMPIQYFNKNATEIIAESFDLVLTDKQIQVFLTKEEEEKAKKELAKYVRPVIVHISSIASKNQEWPVARWKELIAQMPEHTFIQLGLPHEEKIDNAVDLRGKTSFREAMALLKHASAFVGVVSSFAHATNAFNTPGVILFGASTPVVWGHMNNINIYKDLSCAPCIQLLSDSKCPYDSKCMRDISVEEVKNSLLQQLSGKG